MADGKRRYKSDRKEHKVSVKLSEKDMDILKAALNRTGMTASAYIRELIRTGGNIDTSYPEDRARAIRVIAGIANNINQAVKLGNSQGRLYYSDTLVTIYLLEIFAFARLGFLFALFIAYATWQINVSCLKHTLVQIVVKCSATNRNLVSMY